MNFTPGADLRPGGHGAVPPHARPRPRPAGAGVTAWTSLETAVQMVKEGASDYLAKPWDDAKLLAAVRPAAAASCRRKAQARRARARRAPARPTCCGLVYASAAMHRVVSLAVQVAAADVPVLITGPNGAGKEKIAEIVQANSRRPRRALREGERGRAARRAAGERAVRRRGGRLHRAPPSGASAASRPRTAGTLFLDEIGNLSPAGQMKLLRVLQSGEFERLGSSETRRVDVRVLAATNADLRQAIRAGRFREDLFFRLNVIELAVPPLRERPEDILPLAGDVPARRSPRAAAAPRTLDAEARAALVDYAWPGNVRELMNRIQRATLDRVRRRRSSADDLGLDAGAPRRARRGPRTRPRASAARSSACCSTPAAACRAPPPGSA